MSTQYHYLLNFSKSVVEALFSLYHSDIFPSFCKMNCLNLCFFK